MGSGSYELMLRTAFCHQDQRDAPHLPDDEGAEYSFTLVADELFYSDAAGSGRPSWSDESLYRAQAILTFIGTVYEAHRREVKSTYRAAETMGRVTELYPPGIERQDSPLMYIAGNKIVDGIRLCRVMRKGLATKHARAASKEMETWLTSCVDNPVVSVDDIQAELSRLLRACVDEGLVPDEYFHLKTLLKSPEPDQATTQVG